MLQLRIGPSSSSLTRGREGKGGESLSDSFNGKLNASRRETSVFSRRGEEEKKKSWRFWTNSGKKT